MFIKLTSYKIVWNKLSKNCRSCDYIKSQTIIRVSTYTKGNFWLRKLRSGAMHGIQTSKMSTALSFRCALSKYKLYYFSWLRFRNKEDNEFKKWIKKWMMGYQYVSIEASCNPRPLQTRETQVKWQVFISLITKQLNSTTFTLEFYHIKQLAKCWVCIFFIYFLHSSLYLVFILRKC